MKSFDLYSTHGVIDRDNNPQNFCGNILFFFFISLIIQFILSLSLLQDSLYPHRTWHS